MSLSKPHVIAGTRAMAEAAGQWRQAAALAVDTEFVRTDTFYPKLGLIQISDGTDTWLVDPLAIEDFSPLNDILEEPAVLKVFHSCSEDLEVLGYALGVVPDPVFDTQVAGGLTGHGFSRGYAALVKVLLGVELGKHETRSDWLRRPLSEAQLQYAAEDVHYLVQLYGVLRTELDEQGKLPWLREDMTAMVAAARMPSDIDEYHRRLSGAWDLAPVALARLKALVSWREREARERDKPRNRIVSDKILIELARRAPGNSHELGAIKDLHPRTRRIYGDTLLSMLAATFPEGELSDNPLPPPLRRPGRDLLKSCRKWLQQRAEELNLAPEILARKKDLEYIVRSTLAGRTQLPETLANGWRYREFGEELQKHVETLQNL